MKSAPFCAICTDNVTPSSARLEAIDGVIVTLCASCSSEHPRSGRYAFGGERVAGLAHRPSTRKGQVGG